MTLTRKEDVEASQQDAGAAAKPQRVNPFVGCIVACPCISACGIMSACLVTIIATSMVIRKEGAEIFASGGNNDMNDIRTQEWEAFDQGKAWVKVLGQESDDSGCMVGWGSMQRPCDTKTYPRQTQQGSVVLTLFISKTDDNVFTQDKLQQMKTVEDKILKNPGFPDYCLRWDKMGLDKTCSQPMSPLGLFYADYTGMGQASTASVFDTLDQLDNQLDGTLDVFKTAGLDADLSRINAAFMKQGRSFMMGMPHQCDMNGTVTGPAAYAMPATQSCLMSSAVQEAMPSEKAQKVYEAMFPLTAALRRQRGETLQDVDKTLKLAAHMKEVGFYAPQVDYFFDKTFSVSNPKSKHSRGVISFGMPLEGYKNADDKREEQSEKMSTWFREQFNDYLQSTRDIGDVEVLFFATPLIREEFLQIILGDCLKVVVSLSLVFFWIWAQTNSIVIAIAGISEIILSIPLAFFFYYYVCGFKYFDGLNAMTIFIVAAIGADDIFVFMDQYKMSSYYPEVCVDLKTRMAWVYGRASWAMLITSATTCAAFVCTAISPLPGIQSFGIFSAFVIAADYILVITWFPCCVILYHNFLENRPCCPCCFYDAGRETACAGRTLPCGFRCRIMELWPCTRGMTTTTQMVQERGPDEQPKKRVMERCLSGPFAGFLGSQKGAIGTIIFFLLLIIPGAILSSQIQPLSRSEESLPADHPFQRLWTVQGEEFPSSAQNLNTPVHVVWGIDGVDTTGISVLRESSQKKPPLVWDSTFKFDAAAQQHIWNVCEEVRKMTAPKLTEFLSRDDESPQAYGKVTCPLDEWKAWLEQQNKPFPLPLENVRDEMPAFLESTTKNSYGQNQTMKEVIQLGYDPNHNGGSVRVVMIEVESQLQSRASHTRETLLTSYDYFQGWVEEINSPTGRLPAPPSASNAFQTCEGDFNGPNWVWMHTQGLFVQSAITGASVGTVLAFLVILIATQQVIIAFAAFVTISCILVTVIAMMVIADYELGTTTSICITILAGFAVDYVVHLAHAYNHSKAANRADKFQEAFDVIGVSVLSGMVTSVLASLVLLTCALQFFAKFGFFLIFTVLWAWLWGNCFFMCLMRLLGPDESTPWFLQLPHSILPAVCRSADAKKVDASAAKTVHIGTTGTDVASITG